MAYRPFGRIALAFLFATPLATAQTYLISTAAGGQAAAVQLNRPLFVAVDNSNNLLISDFGDQIVRRVSADGAITTIAGVGGPLTFNGVENGQPAIEARLGRLAGIVADSRGTVYVADSDNACVWAIDANGRILRAAGGGYTSGDGGPAILAALNTPCGAWRWTTPAIFMSR